MPVGPFDTFNDCVRHMMDEEGHDEDSARRICGRLEEESGLYAAGVAAASRGRTCGHHRGGAGGEQAARADPWADREPWRYDPNPTYDPTREQSRTDPTGTERVRAQYRGAAYARYADAVGRIEDPVVARVEAAEPSEAPHVGSEAAAVYQSAAEREGLAPTEAGGDDTAAWYAAALAAAYLIALKTARDDLGARAFSSPPDQRLDHPAHRATHHDLRTRQRDLWRQLQQDVATAVAQAVADGVEREVSPAVVMSEVRERVAVVGLNRAALIADHETVRAFNDAFLQEAGLANVDTVTGIAEYETAADDKVCDECAAMAGFTVPVAQAVGILPLHPRCRCRWSIGV